jgi:glycosidase
MKGFILTLLAIFSASYTFTQVISSEPSLPLHNEAVTITFHADQGNKALMNYAGDDVYAHTGVITDKSTDSKDWQYVKAEWDTNIPACKLTKLSANKYQLVISPSIRAFYQVDEGDKILKMAFVFRNSSGTLIGRESGGADIFSEVFEDGMQVSFIQPAGRFAFINEGETVSIEISARESDSVFLYLDEQLLKKTAGTTIDTIIQPGDNQLHTLIAAAKRDNEISYDSSWFIVQGITLEESLPEGMQDGINYIGDDSIVFSIYAPGKESIYLVGDFNQWLPDSIYHLKKSGDHLWIALGNLTPGQEYAFQYIIDENLAVADPYSEKILDPDNDGHIPATVYPGLLQYPFGMAQGIAGVVQPGKPEYIWGDDAFVAPVAGNLLIYELLIRDFVSTHDIKDVALKLDYLQTLGVNAIELMPFSEFEGNSSWGYNPSFYFAVDKYYGRDIDFKNFINECHNRGIAVIMDIVLNHAYGQNPMVRMYYNDITNKPAPDNPWFNENSPNTTYSWGFDFNHESDATLYFVDRVIEYWLTEYKIDGFRFDFTKGFTNTPGDGSAYDASRIAILKRIYDSIRTVSPYAYMICEHFAPNNEEKILSDYGMLIWGNSNYNFNEATMGYLSNSDFSWASYKSRNWTNPSLVSYMESHDEERLMFKNLTYGNSVAGYDIKETSVALSRMELAGVFFFSIPGPKMVWQFGELGYDISIDENGRVGEKPIKWEYLNEIDRERLYLVWAKMMDLRKNNAVFQTNNFTMLVGNNVALKKISLLHSDGDALVVGNFGLTSDNIQPGFTNTGWWYELFSGDSINISDVNHSIPLEPGEYRIYAEKKMESVINSGDDYKTKPIGIYPNPVNDQLFIDSESTIESMSIYSLSGIPVLSVNHLKPSDSIDVSGLVSGMYIIHIKNAGEIRTGKFVKR